MASSSVSNGPAPALPFTLSDPSLLNPDCYVNRKRVTALSGTRFEVLDPGTDKPWISCPDCTGADVDAAVRSCYEAFKTYPKTTTPRQRAELLLNWHNLIKANMEDLARIVVHETGKPLAEARGEVAYALTYSWWFIGEAERASMGSTVVSATPGRRQLVIKQPIGVVAAMVPWNFPLVLCLRKAAAALAAGCTMVVKPSPETPLSALALAELATRAGFPAGCLNVLTTSMENTPSVAEALCCHELVAKVSFTGSTRVGKLLSGWCARGLKKTTLELGGNCPYIVFDDADMDRAATALGALKWRCTGQACVSANRVYVQAGVYDAFVQRVVADAKKLKVGHGMAEGTTMGPVATPRSLDKAEEMARDAVTKGAKMMVGTGKRLQQPGYFMEPAVLTDVTDDMLMSREEIFSPILGISRFETEEEVVRRANDTSMGLTSYVFTKDADRLYRMFENLEAGNIGLVSARHHHHHHSLVLINLAMMLILMTEYWHKYLERSAIRRDQGERPREGVRQRCRTGRVFHNQSGFLDRGWHILICQLGSYLRTIRMREPSNSGNHHFAAGIIERFFSFL